MELCGTPMIHADKSVSHCTQPKNHYITVEDSPHYDEHNCKAEVLVHQSTIRELQALQRYRDQHPEEI